MESLYRLSAPVSEVAVGCGEGEQGELTDGAEEADDRSKNIPGIAHISSPFYSCDAYLRLSGGFICQTTTLSRRRPSTSR